MTTTQENQVELQHKIHMAIYQIVEDKLLKYMDDLNGFSPTDSIDDDTDIMNDIVKTFDRNSLIDYYTLSKTIMEYLALDNTTKNDLIVNSTGELIFSYYDKIKKLNDFIKPMWIGGDGKDDIYIKDNLYFMKYTVDNMMKY
ncbi:hypothetical protein SAMN05661096_01034 [Marivirga sericea]|uniref:Uncharacterized protein n=1 Tax=Marivirga sericea TaxID=1028 RepID=A0A1X7ISM7_9BACT|nr:hypothetical protein [Marivirga sericea]SMG18193.1 hypothetical protein SAMN05661096_01034 [Marivirga sericea]